MQLVILAAGMGSRFGGLKQMEPMDDYGNFILDYSIHDAIRAGFDSVIFIIKREHLEIFRETIGKRVEPLIKTEYAFQDLNDLPEGFKCPEGREKPWGTAHAILAARNLIKDNFIIINGDDYYGQETYEVAAKFLKSLPKDSKGTYANIAFDVANTLAESGSVKRGVCFYDENHYLTKMVESSVYKDEKGAIQAEPLDEKEKPFVCTPGQLVSMNLFAFSSDIIQKLWEQFPIFLKENIQNLKAEFLIPEEVSRLVGEGKASLKLIGTPSVWYGVTYREDKPSVVKALKKLTDKGLYKKGLY
ncbi:MAG: nucleotidyltransferase [Bacilli bacterium]|nr:nucleotidyltransferase [Bacilli bacterium]